MARGRPRKKQQDEAARPGGGATTGYEAELWAMADTLRGLDGCGRVQACRPRANLPQVHLGRLRGEACPPRGGAGPGCRPGGPGRVPRREHVLGAARSPLEPPQGTGPAAHNRPARRWRDGRAYRLSAAPAARQPGAGRAAQGLRPAVFGQAAAWPADMVSNIMVGDEDPNSDRTCCRVYECAVRKRRGQEGRRVLHA